MSLEYLSNDDYRTFITIPESQGEDFTHLANLNTKSGLVPCYVKIYPDTEQSMFNEIIGYLYAKASGIPVPQQAGLIEVSIGKGKDLEPDQIPDKHQWIASQSEVIGWYTSDEQAPSLLSYFGLDNLEELKKKSGKLYEKRLNQLIEKAVKAACEKKHLGSICAFDFVFANVDRNLGNLLFGSTLIAIDQGRIFGGNHWEIKRLPALANKHHVHKIKDLVNHFYKTVPNNVAANASATYDTISNLIKGNQSAEVLKFLDGFTAIDPAAIYKAVDQYLKARLKHEMAYKQTLNRLI